jgi:N-acetylneuraminic acid mutarotase
MDVPDLAVTRRVPAVEMHSERTRPAIVRRRERQWQTRMRRRQMVLVALLALTMAVAIDIVSSGASHRLARVRASSLVPPRTRDSPAVEAGLLPWQLTTPLSRESVLRQRGRGGLMIVGGLESSGSSATGVYSLDTRDGRLAPVGRLSSATHDAAAAEVGDRVLVFGGGTTAPVATTQRLTMHGRSFRGGRLPQPRADAAAITIGRTAYLVGGYGGAAMDSAVLASTDGTRYERVATLLVPVRYPAVAAVGGLIYVFGGASRHGRPVSTVEVVDPHARTARIVGHLPFPLAGAAAASLGGEIYIAGGTRGPDATQPTHDIFAFDSARASFLRAGSLPVAVANAGAAVVGARLWIVGGETAGGRPTSSVQMLVPNRRFGVAGRPGAGSPFYGDRLLIADRGNDRLLLVNGGGKLIWSYPSSAAPAPAGGFYFPDDAFFIRHGHAIISNQEENNTIVEIAYPSGRIIFRYGHARTAGSATGYLDSPDDAYPLRNGDITVADAKNCRVLILDPRTKRTIREIGTPGHCVHRPPSELASPNGDTPLRNGDFLVSEIGGSWIDELTPAGRLAWETQLPISYPSDPQQLGRNRYLVADYASPGAIVEFDRAGHILYRYRPTSGTGVLNHPSLVEQLPSGVFMLNDDYNDRVLAIDPNTNAVVWQYGVTGQTGTRPGMLNTPDGFDLLAPNGTTPTHTATG